ncbi:MAG: universal stress protein [Jatrophihabitans sp.]|nr:MAG: universal stress protein [Jatrophihabitans sp.]
MVVVGSRQLGTLAGAVLGSVSTAAAGAGTGIVVVVGSPPGLEGDRPDVVAGIDGSPVSQQVLAFAFDEASRRGRRLRVVYCWPKDTLAEMQWRVAPPAPERAERWLAETLAGWQEKFPDVTVVRQVVREHPVDGLVRESASQELLVVGARARRGRFASWLGSVSQGVLHHATCPVAVVHPLETEEADLTQD